MEIMKLDWSFSANRSDGVIGGAAVMASSRQKASPVPVPERLSNNNQKESLMIGIPIGLLTANAVEWVFHKHVLHGLGRNRDSFWAFHWHDHHRSVRKNGFLDEDYRQPPLTWN